MAETLDFIKNFQPVDSFRVSFAWNGKHGAELIDTNLEFRRAVVSLVLSQPELASVELLRALVDAETAFDAEAWGTNQWLHTLAEQMLIRGGTEAVPDFLTFWFRGMDAHCELSRVALPVQLATRYGEFCEQQLKMAESPKDRILFADGTRFFRAIAKAHESHAG